MSASTGVIGDQQLLQEVIDVVHDAGTVLRDRFEPRSRPADFNEIVADLSANDDAVLARLKPRLQALRPTAGWVDDELEGGALPAGEWWVTDPAEGNINHVHGRPQWAVTATLIRDDEPVVTVVHLPLTAETYTAVRGGGAYLDGARLHTSAKTLVNAALVGTGQARPGESAQSLRRLTLSVGAALGAALVTTVSVPATLQLIDVAAGRADAFWQYSDVRSGLVAGALLVSEAGGLVTDVAGEPWTTASGDFLAAAPGLHASVAALLARAVQ
jgi:myo-inositol-1(or 4)-monophosphatase